jgi:pilus assembly protein CpaE
MKPIVLVGCTSGFEESLLGAVDESIRPRLRRWSDSMAGPGTVSGLLTTDPGVVILGSALDKSDALRMASEIDQAGRGIAVVVVAELRSATVDAALAAGVRAVVSPDADDATLRSGLQRAIDAADRQIPLATAADAGAGAAEVHRMGRVITVTAPKGGAGKTVLASNLAVGLAREAPRRVVVVDLDLQFGDIAYAFSLEPQHSVVDAAASGADDPTALKVFLSHHEAGLYALCAPDDPGGGDEVNAEAVPGILSRLAAEFDFVVVDTGAGLTEHTLAALDVSTDAILIADADVPSIRHLAKVVATLDRLQMVRMRRHFVLNRADARIGIRMSDVLQGVGLHMDVEIPTAREVPISLSQGIPIVLSNPKSSMAKKVGRLVDRVSEGVGNGGSPVVERSA